jgi:hypothetical protein
VSSSNAFRLICTLVAELVAITAFAAGPVSGPDVIVGEISGLSGTKGTATNPVSSILVTTISCNAGNAPVNWQKLPDANHPVITWNLYRLSDGALTQIGESGVKHAFFAEQKSGVCKWTCDAEPLLALGKRLGPGCADPYGGALMLAPQYSGARSAVNPASGAIDVAHATGQGTWTLAANDQALGLAGSRYFVEAQYIAADAIAAGNGTNSVAYQEVKIQTDDHNPNLWHIPAIGNTHRGCPAILAWEGANFTAFDSPSDGRLIIGVLSRDLGNARHRVDIAVYNMSSDSGVRAVAVPLSGLVVDGSRIGFVAQFPDTESGSHDPWKTELTNTQLRWSTVSAVENPTTNAIRWGQMFSFWFETTGNTSAAISEVDITPFRGTSQQARPIKISGSLKCDPNAYR